MKENSEKTAKNYSKKGRGMNLKLGDVKLGKGGGGEGAGVKTLEQTTYKRGH